MAPPETTPSTQDCNCFAVRSAARHVTQFYDSALADIGLRVTQFSILGQLKRRGPQTINRLAEFMAMDRTTLGRNIVPLKRMGLIRIQPSPGDRRARELHLTATGDARVKAAYKRWQAAQAGFEAAFGADRAAELRTALHAVVATNLGKA